MMEFVEKSGRAVTGKGGHSCAAFKITVLMYKSTRDWAEQKSFRT